MHFNPTPNTSRPCHAQKGYRVISTELCSLMEILKRTTFLSMMMDIYLGFSTGNPQAGILNTGSLLRLCALGKIAGGSKLPLGWVEDNIGMSWTPMWL